MFSPDRYVAALRFAATKHNTQRVPGTELPYVVHTVTVASEVIAALPHLQLADPDLAVQCALLHDTIEDTETTYEDVAATFGAGVADGVLALSKNAALPKHEQMADCFRRILLQPREIAVVKLADRIANMDIPPSYWSGEKRRSYRVEATLIADTLGSAAGYLESRLRSRIEAYAKHLG